MKNTIVDAMIDAIVGALIAKPRASAETCYCAVQCSAPIYVAYHMFHGLI